MSRPFKYQQYLSRIANCPSQNCSEKDKICYRWVHSQVTEKDFMPLLLHPDIPPRKLDNSDVECMGYGLSFFENLTAARENFLYQYHRCNRSIAKKRFLSQKGTNIAEVDIKVVDGVQNEPNNNKHFTFYEYEECPFLDKINCTFNIFVNDDNC